MGTLILNSLEIKNFRGFRHLQIERLGRVNLIVGKNNVGKSSLLEALQIYAYRGSPTLIWELLRAREESKYLPGVSGVREEGRYFSSGRSSIERSVEIEDQLIALKYLFYGRKDVRAHLETIQIGTKKSLDETLSISVGLYSEQVDEEGRLRRQLLEPKEYSTVDNPVPRFTIQMGKQLKIDYPLNPSPATFSRLVKPELREINCVFTAANGLTRTQVGKLWDSISLTALEQDVLTSLRIIAPGVEGLSLVGDPISTRERIPIVKIKDIDDPLPLRSLGDGMQRMLGIALALVNTRDGMLLIDEVENGIHYAVQPEMWSFIFQLACQLNVQVFATTHSWDCIEGFQKAAQEDKQEGLLIRLSIKKDEVGVTLFDEEELSIATRERIEVR
ncbi:MAG: AAA family ATPase [Ktedonobacteraceae bacterium]